MTLLIACILINHFAMPWWWYAIAGLLSIGQLVALAALMNAASTKYCRYGI
jgi:hypothetical protein